MQDSDKITVRQQKLTRKRVFAEYVTSCLVSSDDAEQQRPHIAKYTKTSSARRSPYLTVASKERNSKPKCTKSTKHLGELQQNGVGTNTKWACCGSVYTEVVEIHKHVAKEHEDEIEQVTQERIKEACKSTGNEQDGNTSGSKQSRLATGDHQNKSLPEVLPWLPSEEECSLRSNKDDGGEILLYYKYVNVEVPEEICEWQRELCKRLHLTGKIRIAKEGINGTVGGNKSATKLYMTSVQKHPIFQQIDFKTSTGGAVDFPNGLQVGVHSEICPMGVDPQEIPSSQAGNHLSVEAFHQELETHLAKKSDEDTVFVDCRNFYESRIGQFSGALAPDIRKFSYWPEYVDKNIDAFRDKKVVMYCTGGIRCERGSAYLKSKGVCKDVLQLQGGIHRYMERYPNGYFQGKLFVFDDRYSIATNDTVISSCFYCSKPWDKYQPCSSPHCHQLVLSCPECQGQGSTTCCKSCQEISQRAEVEGQRPKEECECTRDRVRIPQEGLFSDNVQQDERSCSTSKDVVSERTCSKDAMSESDFVQHDKETLNNS